MAKTRNRNIIITAVALLAAAVLFAFAFAPIGSADADTDTGSVAAVVEKTRDTVSAKLDAVKSGVSEKIGVDAEAIEYIWNYGDNVEAGIESATGSFVDMLKNIGQAYDKGDVEGIISTPKTFVDGLKDYLGAIKDTIIP